METSSEVVAPRSPLKQILEVMDLKYPPPPVEQDGKLSGHRLCINDLNATMRYMPCTAEVYRQVKVQKLDTNKKVNFLLTITDGVITGITIKERPDSMPGFAKSKDTPEEHPGALVLERGPDGEAKAQRVPNQVSDAMLADITEGLKKMAQRDVLPGSLIGDRFMILEVQAKIGLYRIFVNPMPR